MKSFISVGEYSDADPIKTIRVDPNQIVYRTEYGWPLKRNRVVDGEWDLVTRKFMENDCAQEIKKRFETNRIGKTDDEIDNLYQSIVKEGYRTQWELLHEDEEQTRRHNNEFTISEFNEITIDVGRDGCFLWRTRGQHRLAIAKCLDLKCVPVMVCKRHPEWQAVRDKVRAANSIDQLDADVQSLLDHPDLQDITPCHT